MLVGKDTKSENKYLESTIDTIKDLLSNYVDLSEVGDKEIVKHRRFLWENRSELDEIEINENCSQVALKEKVHAKQINRIRTLERQLQSPYFARIDFKEDGEDTESFYIGISTVENEADFEFLVFDWRSPVSTMFYDFESGPAYYEAPNRRVEGEIQFSRQFNIRNGEIIFMHNSNESLCDENLNQMLGGNATDKMKNIVATIQKEQNKIIRSEDSKVLFIQGAAGSGKTSIALHRAAYILYKHRKEFKSDNILIFSPNEVFAEYISDVLPELGESNILQTTFEQFSKTFLPRNYIYESKNEHLDYIYSIENEELNIRSKGMEYKNSNKFIGVLNKFINDIPRLITDIKPIVIDGKQVISKKSVEKTFFKRFESIPFLNRLDIIKQSLFSQVETNYLVNNDDFEYVEDKEVFYNYCREEVKSQVDSMISTVNSVDIYKILWMNIGKYSNENLHDIKNLTLEYLNYNEAKFEDITPIIYIRAAMEGFRNYKNVKHILIDEAQDYSPLFYEIVKRSFKDVSMTIMGDLNQRIDNHSNVKEKSEIIDIFDDITVKILTKSYRSTFNITNFTKEILQTREPIEAIERIGENPKVKIVTDYLEIEINKAIEEMKAKGYKSISVICKNSNSSREIYTKLSSINNEVNLIDNDSVEFKIGVNVIPAYLAKGLEFDGVIICDAGNYKKGKDDNLFYTSCTRALHDLYIFGDEKIYNILPKNDKLYNII